MNRSQRSHLVLDYRPSEWTGWEWGKTIGGHHSSKEFTLASRRYQLSLLAGRAASSRDPVYVAEPSGSAVAFRRTLERKFGAWYSFRYRGGLAGRDEFKVQCYSVFATPDQLSFGAQLYLVYQPDRRAGDPAAQAQLGWIQVAQWTGAGGPGSAAPYVDNTECPNPFFISGGLISILGTRVFNFDNPVTAQLTQSPGDHVLSARYRAEVFLARDTATRDTAGKAVIDICAGLRYGWQLQEVTR